MRDSRYCKRGTHDVLTHCEFELKHRPKSGRFYTTFSRDWRFGHAAYSPGESPVLGDPDLRNYDCGMCDLIRVRTFRARWHKIHDAPEAHAVRRGIDHTPFAHLPSKANSRPGLFEPWPKSGIPKGGLFRRPLCQLLGPTKNPDASQHQGLLSVFLEGKISSVSFLQHLKPNCQEGNRPHLDYFRCDAPKPAPFLPCTWKPAELKAESPPADKRR